MFREAIAGAIVQKFEQSEIAETEDLETTVQYAEQHPNLDLVLLDLNMPGMDGLNGIVRMRSTFPDIPIVILSAEQDKKVVLQAMTYGAVGFITKSMPRDKILGAIAQILDGQAYLPPDIIRRKDAPSNTHGQQRDAIQPELVSSLTRRQLLVFECMAKGDSNKQIAYELNIAETTVKAHVTVILRKLKVHNRMKAVLCASTINFDNYLHR